MSKSCADLIAQRTQNWLPVAITRCGNFYGGGDLNWNRIVPGTIRSLLRGERPMIRSDGSFVRDYFYVEDGAAAYMLLAEQHGGGPDLCADKRLISRTKFRSRCWNWCERIANAMDSPLTAPDVRNEATNEIRHQYLSAAKADELLQWTPLFTLEEGLWRAPSNGIEEFLQLVNDKAAALREQILDLSD